MSSLYCRWALAKVCGVQAGQRGLKGEVKYLRVAFTEIIFENVGKFKGRVRART